MKWWVWLIIALIALLIVGLVLLYRYALKMQRRQEESEAQLKAMAQTASILVIDKKMLPIKEAGLPDQVYEQTPKYMRRTKLPIVKAKIGPRIMNLIADRQVFEILPVKKECKVVISGLYITELKSVRGGVVPTIQKKKGFFARMQDKLKKTAKEEKQKDAEKTKK